MNFKRIKSLLHINFLLFLYIQQSENFSILFSLFFLPLSFVVWIFCGADFNGVISFTHHDFKCIFMCFSFIAIDHFIMFRYRTSFNFVFSLLFFSFLVWFVFLFLCIFSSFHLLVFVVFFFWFVPTCSTHKH